MTARCTVAQGFRLLSLLLLFACLPIDSSASPEDIEMAKKIEGNNKVSISFRGGVYVEVTFVEEGQLSVGEARAIFKEFFKSDTDSWRETRYVYMNFYDRGGGFQYQLFLNRDGSSIELSTQRYY